MADETKSTSAPFIALSIAGSDNSAGAGIQADLKTFTAHSVYGLTAVTCVVAEVPGRVESIAPVPPPVVAAQIRMSMDTFPVKAIKTGMLYSAATIETVCDVIQQRHEPRLLVVDPVMIASSGDPLIDEDAIDLYKSRLLPMADLVTPNLDEVRALTGKTVYDQEGVRVVGKELVQLYGVPFLVKGGHLRGAIATDTLFIDGEVHEFSAPFVEGVSTHGTGCTYSAAITAGLARGLEMVDAVMNAKRFITRAIRESFHWTRAGERVEALNHFVQTAQR